MVNHCEDYVNFHDIEHQLQKTSFITFSIVFFYEILSELGSIFDLFKIN